MLLTNFMIMIPEFILAMGSLGLLLAGAFVGKKNVEAIIYGACFLFLFALGVTFSQLTAIDTHPQIIFQGQFVHDTFSMTLKAVILLLAAMALVMTRTLITKEDISKFEYPILILLATLGMMIMVSAKGFLTLFMGLELQSLSLYILSSLKRNDSKASEAGMKYFLLGALSTGTLLYGISLIYGATGGFSFEQVREVVNTLVINQQSLPIGLTVGFIFVLTGLIFKVAVVPFHMWLPDVYEGTPTSITSFLSTVPKVAAFGMIIRVLIDPFGPLVSQWIAPLMYLSMASMILGSFAVLVQSNIKRFLAYSAIANAGFSFMGLMVPNVAGVEATLLYVVLYALTVFGFFACLIFLSQRGEKVETISDLAGIVKIYPGVTFIMVVFLFSLAGLPAPMAGFFAKLYIFNSALSAGLMTFAIIGILTSLLLAAYYLRIIKVMLMDEINTHNWNTATQIIEDKALVAFMVLICLVLLAFFISPSFFTFYLSKASSSLFVL